MRANKEIKGMSGGRQNGSSRGAKNTNKIKKGGGGAISQI